MTRIHYYNIRRGGMTESRINAVISIRQLAEGEIFSKEQISHFARNDKNRLLLKGGGNEAGQHFLYTSKAT